MTNWRDPVRVFADYVILVKLVHVLGGLYIWEFVTNIDYEYSIITGKRKFSRAFPLYLGCRLSPLSVVILQFLVLDVSHGVNCQVLIIMSLIVGYLSFLFASALIVLRISALWEHNKVVIALASAAWLANATSYIYSAATSRGYWTGINCAILHTEHTKISILSTLITDLVLLSLVLIGVLRWKEARQKGGVWWVLYTQGLTWVAVITLAEIPPLVFVFLDLNVPMDLMFLSPGLIIMSFGASRMYRGLADYLTANDPSTRPVSNKEQSRSSSTKIWFASRSQPHSTTEGTYSAGGTVADSDVLPSSRTHP
ncbi:hypothetical protein BJV78DRAFT_1171688 [Lactifluus subvellereus]|nr:hypothetical protein BJV78DRAFT_1171688 [Lactifluus subvellereus]